MQAKDAYLDARYTCTALWAKARPLCPAEAAHLKQGLDRLCAELRSLLRQAGEDTVGRKFDPRLLQEDTGRLLAGCREAAARLARLGSLAGSALLEALEEAARCLEGRRGED